MTDRLEHPNGYWAGPDDFDLLFVIDFKPFEVKITRGKKAGTSYMVGPVMSWKRARQPTTFGGHSSIGLTPKAKKWAAAAAAQLKMQWPFNKPIPKDALVTAAITTYLPNARKADASNLYQGPEDVMQSCRIVAPGKKGGCKPSCKMHAGILTDDVQIENHDGSGRRIDRVRPRFEIRLRPFRGEAQGVMFGAELEPKDLEF